MLIQLLDKNNDNGKIKLSPDNIDEFKNKFTNRPYLNKTDINQMKQYQTTFNDITGNEEIKKRLEMYACALINEIAQNYNIYFHGEPGTGKTTLANAFINHITSLEKEKKIALFEINTDTLALNKTIAELQSMSEQLAEEGHIVILYCNEINTILNRHVDDPLRAMLINLLDKKNISMIGSGNTQIADGALERRFTSIKPEKPTTEDLEKILQNYVNKKHLNNKSIKISINRNNAEKAPPTAADAIKRFEDMLLAHLYFESQEHKNENDKFNEKRETDYFTITLTNNEDSEKHIEEIN